jgi:hypothetical protein
MAEPDGNGISARLWRLPGQLLLALINGLPPARAALLD